MTSNALPCLDCTRYHSCYGSLPVKEAILALKAHGYVGYLSMEWVKRWHEGLEDAGLAFPHYIHQVRCMLRDH